MRRAIGVHLAAFAVLVAVAACGGAAPPSAQVAPTPTATESGVPGQPPQAGPVAPEGTVATPTTTPTGPLGPLGPPVEMKAPIPTAMADDLRALGLDAKNLPPIEKLEPRTLRGVMKLLARSLGVKCGDCHQEGDYAAPTRRKRIAAHMWDAFAAKMVLAGEGQPLSPLFCDSCHQGRTQLLDRRDKKALSAWMDENFVARLAQKDGQKDVRPTECETCHVDMDMHFLAKWGGTGP
jgi:Cytochrome c7 and related cytochrome c